MSGRKKKGTQTFQVGKGIKTDSSRSPLKGVPNTNLDTYSKDNGEFRSRKKYGEDGFAVKDLDVGHFDHNFIDHAHDYIGSRRSKERELSDKERREMSKAKRKRRFWK